MNSENNMSPSISPKIWGPPLWDILHYITFNYSPSNRDKVRKIFLYHLPNLMPCKSCRDNYKKHMKKYPIQLDNRSQLSRWLVKIHNETNKYLNKKHSNTPGYTPKKIVSYEDVSRKYCTNVPGEYVSKRSIERVHRKFLKWAQIMRYYVQFGSPSIQASYSMFNSYIFTKV